MTIYLLILLIVTLTNGQKRKKNNVCNELEPRARLLIVNGHMYFHAGQRGDITFLPGRGGAIYFDKLDLISMMPKFESGIAELKSNVITIGTSLSAARSIIEANRRSIDTIRVFLNNMVETQRKLVELNNLLNSTGRKGAGNLPPLLKSMRRNLRNLRKKLAKNECKSEPCQNGATCIDLVGKYKCLCPETFTGERCEIDIDECTLYSGTDIGCQNGATCSNSHGGFVCHCRSGYYGPLCSSITDACSDINSHTLCGEHGLCHSIPKNAEDQASYTCICDAGYTRSADKANPSCLDVNECDNSTNNSGNYPCYPEVSCINLPGSFKCSDCPLGMTGNGRICSDIDECAASGDNTCSKDPKVECINTFGSYKCGTCPMGFVGNGTFCSPADQAKAACNSSDCSPNALSFNTVQKLTGE